MKIKIDTYLTDPYYMERTRNQIKEFQSIHTDGELLRMFQDAIDDWRLGYAYEIIQCNLRAFNGGYQETDETHYQVKMILEGHDEYIRLDFYVSQSGEIDMRTIHNNGTTTQMYSVRHYKLDE